MSLALPRGYNLSAMPTWLSLIGWLLVFKGWADSLGVRRRSRRGRRRRRSTRVLSKLLEEDLPVLRHSLPARVDATTGAETRNKKLSSFVGFEDQNFSQSG